MIEALSKILDAIAKYAWGVLVVCLLVVLLPDKATEAMGLNSLKGDYLGYWWIGLIFSGAIWLGSIFSHSISWLAKAKSHYNSKTTIIKRLYSLDNDEQCWIAYCLLHDTQTLSANQTNQTANSLENKGIVTQGSGSILCLPYHMRDFIWEYLRKHKEDFLPPELLQDAEGLINIERFAAGLTEII